MAARMPGKFEYIDGEMTLYCKPGDVLFHDYKLWHSAARATSDHGEGGTRRHLRGIWYSGQKNGSFPEVANHDLPSGLFSGCNSSSDQSYERHVVSSCLVRICIISCLIIIFMLRFGFDFDTEFNKNAAR
eukprot:scaffold35960_cov20-Prasinocladus_malaysianus.AAC.3